MDGLPSCASFAAVDLYSSSSFSAADLLTERGDEGAGPALRNPAERSAYSKLARAINESIAERHAAEEDFSVRWFLCECSRPDCGEVVDVGAEKFHEIRTHPQRFLTIRGHEDPSIEAVVESHGAYVIVEQVSGTAEGAG
jgi:hypothetical protein